MPRAKSIAERIDPEVIVLVDIFRNARVGEQTTAEGFTAAVAAMFAALGITGEPAPREGVATENRKVPGPAGAPEIRLRIYRPTAPSAPRPGLYWIHGGGMVTGTVEQDEALCQKYVAEAGAVAVSVEYRLAPAHPFPAGVEDCYAGLAWMAANAAALGIDPVRLGIAGASGGGGLAAAVALLARDRKGPRLALQQLIYPMLDDRLTTPSSREFTGDTTTASRENIIGCWNAVLQGKAGAADVSPYAAPARATDLSGLPPTYIHVGELEVFRDESIEYAQRLMQAGVPTELHVHPGAVHGWDLGAPDSGLAHRAIRDQFEYFTRLMSAL